MSEKGSATRIIVDNFIKTNHLNIKTNFELSNNEAIKRAVAEGLGITFHKDKYFSQILNYFIDVTRQWASQYTRTLYEIYSFNNKSAYS